MGFEELRIRLIEHLRGCQCAEDAQDLLADANLMLRSSQLAEGAQRMFWRTLGRDLDVIAKDLPLLLGEGAAAHLSVVLPVAQQLVAQYGDGSPLRFNASE